MRRFEAELFIWRLEIGIGWRWNWTWHRPLAPFPVALAFDFGPLSVVWWR